MFPIFAAASAAEALPEVLPFAEPRRYFLQSTVQLPLYLWFTTPFNHQARVTGFDLRLLADCAAGTPNTRRSSEVLCTITEIGLSATGMEQERGLLQPILTELDELLTGTVVQLQVREGNLQNIDLESVYRRNNRVGRLQENMRLVLSRAFAGLDFPVPDDGTETWPEYGSMLMWMPSANGTSGTSEVLWRVTERGRAANHAECGGTGVIQPGDDTNRYDARIAGGVTWDPRSGQVLDRHWLLVAHPTPSSPISFGTAGYPYLQQGRVVALDAGQSWDVGESLELEPSEFQPSAIQQQFQLGLDPSASPVRP